MKIKAKEFTYPQSIHYEGGGYCYFYNDGSVFMRFNSDICVTYDCAEGWTPDNTSKPGARYYPTRRIAYIAARLG
jgi:hypothetical protein